MARAGHGRRQLQEFRGEFWETSSWRCSCISSLYNRLFHAIPQETAGFPVKDDSLTLKCVFSIQSAVRDQMPCKRRKHVSKPGSLAATSRAIPALKAYAAAVVVLLAAAVAPSRAQQAAPAASGRGDTQMQEDTRAVRTREFLGLGRMPDARMAAEGAKLFGPTCGFCHGTDARGGTGPDLLRSPVVLDDNQGEIIGPTVHDGRPAKGMPAFPSFTDDQLRDIAEFLHLQVELAANRGTYKILNVVTGDAKAGQAYFNGAGKCNTCHSATGDLAHLGSKLEPSDLQQDFLYPGARGFSGRGSEIASQGDSDFARWKDDHRHGEASGRFLYISLRRGGQLPFDRSG